MTTKQAKLILGININGSFTLEELTRRYRELMKMNHPDMHASENEKTIARFNEKCSLFNEAYSVLKSYLEDTESRDQEFIFMKAKAINEIRSIFEECSDTALRQKVEKIYTRNVAIEDCKDVIELDSAVENFYALLRICYKNYEIGFRRQNGIPKKFDFSLRYDCNTDEFVTELSELEKAYESYIDSKINGTIYTYFNMGDSVTTSPYLDNRIDGMKYLFHNYNLFDYEERGILEDFRDFIKEKHDYYVSISYDYLDIKRLIDKLPGTYEDKECEKSRLLCKLNDSVYKGDFDVVSEKVLDSVYKFEYKERAINKLQTYLNWKSFLVSSRLKSSKDKASLDYVYSIMSICTEILSKAYKGKYSIEDISILENITFSDKNTDKMILSMLNNKGFNIYVKIPNEEIEKLYNPFVLKNDDDEFLSTDGNGNVSLESKEEVKKNSTLISLSDIVTYGTPVFRYTSDGETIDNVLYQYNGYDLVCNYDACDGRINDFYLTGATDHKGYDYSEQFEVKSKVAYKVQSMFRPYTKKIQKKNKGKKLLKISSI